MGTTANFGYPYPEPSDRPTGDAQIKALAQAAADHHLYAASTGALAVVGAAWTVVPRTITSQVGGFAVTSGLITVPVAGLYAVWGFMRVKSDGWDHVYGHIAGFDQNYGSISTTPNKAMALSLSAVGALAAGTGVGLRAQNLAGGTGTTVAVEYSHLGILRLGPAPGSEFRADESE